MTASVKAPELSSIISPIPDTRPGAMTSAVRFFRSVAFHLLLSADKSGYACPHIHARYDVMLFLHEAVPRFCSQNLRGHNSPCFVDIFRILNRPEVPTIKTSAPAAISFCKLPGCRNRPPQFRTPDLLVTPCLQFGKFIQHFRNERLSGKPGSTVMTVILSALWI